MSRNVNTHYGSLDYFREHDLLKYLKNNKNFPLNNSNNLYYLQYIHQAIANQNKSTSNFTITWEFKSGLSTLVIAHAISLWTKKMSANLSVFYDPKDYPILYSFCKTLTEQYKVRQLILKCENEIQLPLSKYIYFHVTEAQMGLYNSHICHQFTSYPPVIPTSILVNGSTKDVEGSFNGISPKQMTIPYMSVDPLHFEFFMQENACIYFPNNWENLRFLKANFSGDWKYEEPRRRLYAIRLAK